MRKDNQLPRFGHSARYQPREEERNGPEQSDWLDETPRPQQTVTESRSPQPPVQPRQAAPGRLPVPPVASRPEPKPAPRKGLWWLLSFGWLRPAKKQEPLVQSELDLANVRVVRNDLADSDLEVVVVRKKKAPIFTTTVTNPNGNWNSLTAKLFDLGQNQR